MPRNDLSETEVNTLSRRAGNVIDDNYAWTLTRAEASKIQRLAGEVLSLRETNAQISQMAQSEQEW
jgi:hypothetical protein